MGHPNNKEDYTDKVNDPETELEEENFTTEKLPALSRYFKDLNDILESENAMKTLLNFFLHAPIDEFNYRTALNTRKIAELKFHGLPEIDRWWFSRLKESEKLLWKGTLFDGQFYTMVQIKTDFHKFCMGIYKDEKLFPAYAKDVALFQGKILQFLPNEVKSELNSLYEVGLKIDAIKGLHLLSAFYLRLNQSKLMKLIN